MIVPHVTKEHRELILSATNGVGVYRPGGPRASPLYRLLEDHFAEFSTVYGILEHGFARVRCGACKHESEWGRRPRGERWKRGSVAAGRGTDRGALAW